MKRWSGGSHIFIRSASIVPGDNPLMVNGYKYRYNKLLGFIAKDGGVIIEPGVPYLYHYPKNISNVYIFPIIHNRVIGRYVSARNSIYKHNSMCQYYLALDKYWVTQSGYFIR